MLCLAALFIVSFCLPRTHFVCLVVGGRGVILCCSLCSCGPGSVVGIATGYGLVGPRIESRWGARFSAPVHTGLRAHPASCTMGIGSFPWVKSGRGVTLTPHLLLVSWSWKSRAIPLLPSWAVRPVQSLSACTRVHFTLLLPSVWSQSHYSWDRNLKRSAAN